MIDMSKRDLSREFELIPVQSEKYDENFEIKILRERERNQLTSASANTPDLPAIDPIAFGIQVLVKCGLSNSWS